MTGLLWDSVSIIFDSLPVVGKEWSYRHARLPDRKQWSTDPIVKIQICTRTRLAFSTVEVDYQLELGEGCPELQVRR